MDEALEAAVVWAAKGLIEQSETTHQAYDRLVDLLERQPNLSVRSSTSVLQQAYSTPIPIAYLASVLADINSETTVYEPTAGNGALLIAANPAKVIANEINADRFSELSTQGYRQLTQQNAIEYRPQNQSIGLSAIRPSGLFWMRINTLNDFNCMTSGQLKLTRRSPSMPSQF